LFCVGGTLKFISADIGGATISSWLPISHSLALAAVAPFYGYLQDLFGRRNITLAGGVTLCVGIIVVATASSMGAAIARMTVADFGAAIGESTALSGQVAAVFNFIHILMNRLRTSELVPVNKRGLYLAFVTFFVLPFCPWPMYTQLSANYHTWRWGLWICL
jgi:MFS family permease